MATQPKAPAPNPKLAIAAVALIGLGLAWSMYTLNPGGMLRGETEEETKARKEIEREKELEKKGIKGPAH